MVRFWDRPWTALMSAILAAASARQAVAAPVKARVGEEVYRADVSENLVGSGRELDTVIVRYLGAPAPGQALFERTDVKMIDASSIHNAEPPVALPPVATRIAVDIAADPELRLNGRAIHILAATASMVTYDAGP
jgi:hypothetical protein